jgi:aspartyl-tRNA(Asn)/glutamyl-tRNA(Gln) amidotransferase subunit A
VFEEMGGRVEEADYRPDPPEAVFENFVTFSAARTYASHPHDLDKKDRLTDYYAAALERGRSVTGEQLWSAISHIWRYRAYTTEFFTKYDLLLSPTLAVPAFLVGHAPEVISGKRVFSTRLGFYPFTYPFNITGNPAASVPCGFARGGPEVNGGGRLPVGLQIVGRMEDEETVLAASAAFEQARPWLGRRPPVC